MLVRRDEFRASKIMASRVKNTENIEILFNTETDEVLGDGQVVTGVRAKNNKTNALVDIPATGFFARQVVLVYGRVLTVHVHDLAILASSL